MLAIILLISIMCCCILLVIDCILALRNKRQKQNILKLVYMGLVAIILILATISKLSGLWTDGEVILNAIVQSIFLSLHLLLLFLVIEISGRIAGHYSAVYRTAIVYGCLVLINCVELIRLNVDWNLLDTTTLFCIAVPGYALASGISYDILQSGLLLIPTKIDLFLGFYVIMIILGAIWLNLILRLNGNACMINSNRS